GAKDENTGAGLCRSRLVVQERLGHYICIIVNKRMTNSITQYPNGPVVQAIRLIYFYFCK
ncbi:hypothetical protein, partial [Escherichia coli]|uniref:hypothetical protein n=1 Tax=Escherichia coli TaxID=562 RepID=UPI001BC865E3